MYEIFTINHVKLCLAHAIVVVYFSDEDAPTKLYRLHLIQFSVALIYKTNNA